MNASTAEALIPRFQIFKILNQDQGGRRLTLQGSIDSKPTLLLLERSAFPSSLPEITALHAALTSITNLGANDIYAWYLASHASITPAQPGLKINLIHPCTEKHVRKYSPQTVRVVTEIPEVFKNMVRPFMERERGGGRLDWVFNIIEGRTEQEDIIVRESRDLGKDEEGFLLLPDMNWDRSTMGSLRILGLVERRDLWSLRDLRKKDVVWLKGVYRRVLRAVAKRYEDKGVEEDMLKVYMHYQPTYYHFHMHIVSVDLEPNATQAVGKAFSLPNLIAQLETMAGGPETGMMDVDLTYTVGDKSDLWTQIYAPLKEKAKAKSSTEIDST